MKGGTAQCSDSRLFVSREIQTFVSGISHWQIIARIHSWASMDHAHGQWTWTWHIYRDERICPSSPTNKFSEAVVMLWGFKSKGLHIFVCEANLWILMLSLSVSKCQIPSFQPALNWKEWEPSEKCFILQSGKMLLTMAAATRGATLILHSRKYVI